MQKYPLIGVSILAVILLVLGSLSNVVGYQAVQLPNPKVMNERVNQKELLFQTIVDIANNKEIQRIILKSQISRGIFPTSDIPVLTKNQLKVMYFIGLMLSKVISKSKIHSMVPQYQFNPEVQKEISSVIEKDATLNAEITQLQNSECDCEKDTTAIWHFPILCNISAILGLISYTLFAFILEGELNYEEWPEFIKKFIDFSLFTIGLISFYMFGLMAVILILFHCIDWEPPYPLIII